MKDIYILLSDDTSNEEKHEAAENIITNNELPLSTQQILFAFKKVLDWVNARITPIKFKNDILFLFDKVLNINKNMYTAIILALCDNFNPVNLIDFRIFSDDISLNDIGLNAKWHFSAILSYKILLDHYEFDVSSMKNISDEDKQIIQDYRAEKYSCKLTKCAIKKMNK